MFKLMSGLGMSGLGMGMGGGGMAGGMGGLKGLLDSSPSPLGTGPTVREFAEVVAKGGAGGGEAGAMPAPAMSHEAMHMGQGQGVPGLLGQGGGMQGFAQMFGGKGGDRMQQFQTLMRLFGGL